MIETGIFFDNIHSFRDLNLILSKPPDIPPAQPKTNYVDVPGADGSVDLTEAHGEVKFSDRNCKFTFTVNPQDELTFEERATAVSNRLNGRVFKIVLDKDAEYYYQGRCAVDSRAINKKIHQIVIAARVAPYKMRCDETVATITLSDVAKTVVLTNDRKTVVPTITTTDENTVIVFGGKTITIESPGTHRVLDICFTEGENALIVSGSGTLKITWREGAL